MHSLSPDAPPSSFTRDALALAPLVERFCDGRRVAVLGAATSGLGAELARRGARLVHCYDPDPARVAEALITLAARGVTYAALTDGDLGVRDGAFDVTVVHDLKELGDAAPTIARARKITAPSGVVIVANGRGDGALGYYDFYDAVSLQFSQVKMLGRVSFEGASLVDLASGGEGEVSVDTSLAPGGREPESFVAVASERAVSVAAFTLVELPATPRPDVDETASTGLELAELRAQLAAAEGEVERLREDRVSLAARVSEADRRAGGAVSALVDAETVARAAEAKLVEESRAREMISAELQKLRHEARSQRASEVDARALADANAALVRAEARERALAGRVADLENELRQRSADASGAKAADLAQAKTEVARVTAELAAAKAELSTMKAELSTTKAELSTRARELASSKAELAKATDALTKAAALPKVDATPRGPTPEAYAALEARLADVEARLRDARAAESRSSEGVAAELAVAEAALRERAREIAALKREIENRGDMVRDLVAQVSAFTGSGALGARGG